MHKLVYFYKKNGRLMSVYFTCMDDLLDYLVKEYEDIDLINHFIKIVKE